MEENVPSDIELRLTKAFTEIKKSNMKDISFFDVSKPVTAQILFERKEIAQIIKTLQNFFNINLREHLFIRGPKGSGKTALTKWIIDHAIESRRAANLGEIEFRYINCKNVYDSYNIEKKICGITKRKLAEDIKASTIQQLTSPNPKIILLDEIDQLKDDEFFYLISREAQLSNVLIVSTFKTDNFLRVLSEDVQSSLNAKVLDFNRYNAVELFDLLKKRADLGLVEYSEEILAIISAINVRKFGSDARLGITATSKIFTMEDYSKVDQQQVYDVLLEENVKLQSSIISQLDKMQQYILYSAIIFPNSIDLYHDLKQKYGSLMTRPHFDANLRKLQTLDLIIYSRGRKHKKNSCHYEVRLEEEAKKDLINRFNLSPNLIN